MQLQEQTDKRRLMPMMVLVLSLVTAAVAVFASGSGHALAQDPMPVHSSEFSDLDRVMSLSVETVSPSVVRVLVPEYSKEQQKLIAQRNRRQRVDQMQAEALRDDAERQLQDAARDNPRLQALQKRLQEMSEKLTELEGDEFARQLQALQQLLREIEAAKPQDDAPSPADPAAKDDSADEADGDDAAEDKAAPPAEDNADNPADAPAADTPKAEEQAEELAEDDDGQPIVPIKQHPRSGVVVASDGYIITSLAGCGRQRDGLQVELADGRILDAKALGEDVRRDVLLLKVEAEGLPAVVVVPRDDLQLGQWVLALGRALPIGGTTVTKGIISSLRRHAGLTLQTDANISPVNFGGLLADIRGRGVAMIASVDVAGSTASASRYSDSGIGFAVPLEDIMAHFATLKDGKTIEPPFLGVQFNMTRLQSGAQVQEVIRNTAAAAAGMKSGDIIIELEGKPVESSYQLLHEIGSRSVGDSITVKVRRGEEVVELQATLRARPTRYRG